MNLFFTKLFLGFIVFYIFQKLEKIFVGQVVLVGLRVKSDSKLRVQHLLEVPCIAKLVNPLGQVLRFFFGKCYVLEVAFMLQLFSLLAGK